VLNEVFIVTHHLKIFYETGGVEPLLEFYFNIYKNLQSLTRAESRNIKGEEKIANITQSCLAFDL
jgi:hypothetical protein